MNVHTDIFEIQDNHAFYIKSKGALRIPPETSHLTHSFSCIRHKVRIWYTICIPANTRLQETK